MTPHPIFGLLNIIFLFAERKYSATGQNHAAGRILRQEDASGWQIFSYGPLGEVTENIRTFALPNESRPYTFKMQYSYDSHNRIQTITYPDGEVVSYGYDRGGMLKNMQGDKNGNRYPYIDDIAYNKFGLKEAVWYGNGTKTFYKYDMLQRLDTLRSYDIGGNLMQDIAYTYDVVGNITDIENYASVLPNGLGGPYSHHHDYDPLYRIEHSEGWWGQAPLPYTLDMEYHDNGRIQRKTLSANTLNLKGDTVLVDYDNLYHYVAGCSKLREVTSAVDTLRRQAFAWSGAGNLIEHQSENDCLRRLCWDNENRMQGFADCVQAGFYQYDAGGERTYKLTGDYTVLNQSGQWHHFYALDNPTLYASPYMVCTPKGYTKHYYAESERVASRIGNGGIEPLCRMVRLVEMPEVEPEEPDEPEVIEEPEMPDKPDDEQLQDPVPAPFALGWEMVDCGAEWETFNQKRSAAYRLLQDAMSCVNASFTAMSDQLHLQEWEYEHEEEQEEGTKKESDCYWYHPDHLGSSSWITDTAGTAVQHLHYLPWGEDMVNQRTTSYNARYTFSAKEKDAETGYSYFGARYYSSDLSIWLSVDPMADKYPSMSPYTYCADNPVMLVDPNGMFDDESEAIKVRNRAARRFGEKRVSEVFNNTIDGGKADYAFRIYGKGKSKYSRSGGTNEDGGPIITADQADKTVYSTADYKDYKKSHKNSYLEISLTATVGTQYGCKMDSPIGKIGIMGNVSSLDIISFTYTENPDKETFDYQLIDRSFIQSNSGFDLGPISYNYHTETSYEKTINTNHSLSLLHHEILNSNKAPKSFSVSGAVIIGFRLDVKKTRKQ